ncbi:hypothetical protein AAC387_Pa03g1700 [Persea americana]
MLFGLFSKAVRLSQPTFARSNLYRNWLARANLRVRLSQPSQRPVRSSGPTFTRADPIQSIVCSIQPSVRSSSPDSDRLARANLGPLERTPCRDPEPGARDRDGGGVDDEPPLVLILKANPNVYMTWSACHSTRRCGSPTASSGSSSRAKTGAGPEYHKNGSDTTVWQVGE